MGRNVEIGSIIHSYLGRQYEAFIHYQVTLEGLLSPTLFVGEIGGQVYSLLEFSSVVVEDDQCTVNTLTQ